MEGLLENVRQLSRELKLQMLIIDNFIPPEYQVLLDSNLLQCIRINDLCLIRLSLPEKVCGKIVHIF